MVKIISNRVNIIQWLMFALLKNILFEGPFAHTPKKHRGDSDWAVSPGRCKPRRQCHDEFWEPWSLDSVYIFYMYMYIYRFVWTKGNYPQNPIIAVVPINIALWGENQFSAHPICRFVYNLVYIYIYIDGYPMHFWLKTADVSKPRKMRFAWGGAPNSSNWCILARLKMSPDTSRKDKKGWRPPWGILP